MTKPIELTPEAKKAPIFAFLLGEAPLEGCWWGERPEDSPAFWWRNNLREALKELDFDWRQGYGGFGYESTDKV